jgi:hypothetical protein
MHLSSPQRNTDINAKGLQAGYQNIFTQGRSTAVEANFFNRNTLQLCYLFLQKSTANVRTLQLKINAFTMT